MPSASTTTRGLQQTDARDDINFGAVASAPRLGCSPHGTTPLECPTSIKHASAMKSPQPVRRVVQLVAGRWTTAILAQLVLSGRRYQELHEALGGMSHKVLTETLRRAERDGLIDRYLDAAHVETATL